MSRTATRPTTDSDIGERATGLLPLSAEEIAAQTNQGSFTRGQGYDRSHHVFSAIRRDYTLRARCHGSSGGPYLVEATLATSDQERTRNRLPMPATARAADSANTLSPCF